LGAIGVGEGKGDGAGRGCNRRKSQKCSRCGGEDVGKLHTVEAETKERLKGGNKWDIYVEKMVDVDEDCIRQYRTISFKMSVGFQLDCR
jgi:hypothetical protein